jgi:hypothetical protein
MLMRNLALLCLILSALHSLFAQNDRYKLACVAYYNFENLFDTLDSEHTNDFEFTPQGSNRYDSEIYYEKLDHLARVVSEIGTDITPDGPAVLGVSEIENRRVLEDFVAHEKVASRNYQIVHRDSRDGRGIDVALLYQPKYFSLDSVEIIPLMTEIEADGDTNWSRDILIVHGEMDGDPVTFSVNHWPSRHGGEAATSPLRNKAAWINRKLADSLFQLNPYHRMIVMGDMNDDPVNESMQIILSAIGDKNRLRKGQFYNPYMKMFKKGIGTTAYQDAWSLFDQIVLSPGYIAEEDTGFEFYQAHIFNPNYLIQHLGQYQGYPFRTYGGGVYLGGYSDHFPVYVFLVKAVK